MTCLLAVGAVLVAIGYLVGTHSKPPPLLAGLDEGIAAVRAEVASFKSAHAYIAESLERRLGEVEASTALTAVELRIVSQAVLAAPPDQSPRELAHDTPLPR